MSISSKSTITVNMSGKEYDILKRSADSGTDLYCDLFAMLEIQHGDSGEMTTDYEDNVNIESILALVNKYRESRFKLEGVNRV